jgi:hypothetical protein
LAQTDIYPIHETLESGDEMQTIVGSNISKYRPWCRKVVRRKNSIKKSMVRPGDSIFLTFSTDGKLLLASQGIDSFDVLHYRWSYFPFIFKFHTHIIAHIKKNIPYHAETAVT